MQPTTLLMRNIDYMYQNIMTPMGLILMTHLITLDLLGEICVITIYNETCLNRTSNEKESCIYRTLNKVPMYSSYAFKANYFECLIK
jgi:hypothetical protein